MRNSIYAFVAALGILSGEGVSADVCDYKPSKLAGQVGAAVLGGTALAGAGMKAAGFYTLVHAGSGLTMLGSTAAGASAAGTIGIIGGTGGAVGTVGAILMAPVTLFVGGVVFVGGSAYEGVCYFQVDRVTDPYKLRSILEGVADNDETVAIVKSPDGDALVLTDGSESSTYLLRKLYIADGQLKYRRWGPVPNSTIGPVVYMAPEASD